ncbi:hypothetical protein ACA910_020021 [Epithemia clementina (nom. ined.)]
MPKKPAQQATLQAFFGNNKATTTTTTANKAPKTSSLSIKSRGQGQQPNTSGGALKENSLNNKNKSKEITENRKGSSEKGTEATLLTAVDRKKSKGDTSVNKRAILDDDDGRNDNRCVDSKPPTKQRRRVIQDDDEESDRDNAVEENTDQLMADEPEPQESTMTSTTTATAPKVSPSPSCKDREKLAARRGHEEEEDEQSNNKTKTEEHEAENEAGPTPTTEDNARNAVDLPAPMEEEKLGSSRSTKEKAKAKQNSFFQPKTTVTRKKTTTTKATSDESSTTTKAKPPSEERNDATQEDSETENDHNDDNENQLVVFPPTALYKAAPEGQFWSDKKIWDDMDTETWPVNSSVPYLVLCQVFGQIEEISGRLQIQELLTKLLRQILLRRRQQQQQQQQQQQNDGANSNIKSIDSDLSAVLYLASNEVAPAYKCVELGIGDAILIKAIGEATGTAPNMVKAKYEAVGDLGTVAMTFKSKQKTLGGFFGKAAAPSSKTNGKAAAAVLAAQTVLQVFREIAETKGNQAQKWKVDKIKRLLVKASVGMETKYIIRGLQGKLRIGLAQSTVLIALAHALALTSHIVPVPPLATLSADDEDCDVDEKNQDLPDEAKQFIDSSLTVEKRLEGAVNIIKKAYSEVPSYDSLLDAALSVPLEQMHKKCTLQPGIPVSPMLAKPTKSIQEVLKRLTGQLFTCEYKYDGERAQVHLLPDGTTKVFSRNLLDTSEKYPEVPKFVREACESSTVQSFVMDAEVVAFNPKTGQLVPFQVLSTRKKTQESNEVAKVQIIVQAFDLMYLNGESLLRQPLFERRQLLHKHFVAVPGKFQFAKALDHQENGDTAVIEEFLDQAVKGQCEGLMVKTLNDNAMYEPSRRSLNWLKLKKDYLEGLGDSVDLVPLGAYHGKGKRTGVYGAYLLACYDVDSEEFQSVCKIGTGFSDDDLKSLAETLNQHVIPAKSSQYNVSEGLQCDVWFDAVQVWEIKAADLSQSSAHRGAAGKLSGDRGIGLRFPRFERIRDDKKPAEATTSEQILDMYYNQDAIVGGGGDDDDDLDGI